MREDRLPRVARRSSAARCAKIVCLQELFYGPYFCTEQNPKWYEATEPIPDGPTTRLMCDLARELRIVLIVPMYEVTIAGVYYNTAAVIDADGSFLGKYRKHHLPQVEAGPAGCGFWEKFYFKPGNEGYPTFRTAYAQIGVYICFDRHFPEGARLLGLNGAEIVFNPSATVAGLSEYLWILEQPAHAVANGYYLGAINRVGFETPWNMGEFYGQSHELVRSRRGGLRGQRRRARADSTRAAHGQPQRSRPATSTSDAASVLALRQARGGQCGDHLGIGSSA